MRPALPKSCATPPPGTRFLAALLGLVFLGAGLLIFTIIWFTNDFGPAVPVMFRLFFSAGALVFIAFGGFFTWAGASGKVDMDVPAALATPQLAVAFALNASYKCGQCGAPLDRHAAVMDSGEVQCTSCGGRISDHHQ